jgi:hypothetical protein
MLHILILEWYQSVKLRNNLTKQWFIPNKATQKQVHSLIRRLNDSNEADDGDEIFYYERVKKFEKHERLVIMCVAGTLHLLCTSRHKNHLTDHNAFFLFQPKSFNRKPRLIFPANFNTTTK